MVDQKISTPLPRRGYTSATVSHETAPNDDGRQPTGATLFAGFEGVGIGMKAAGINHLWSIEKEDDIAAVARMNGFDVLTADILDCDLADFEQVDFLHASPPCPNFSNAKANGEETELDIALARKVAEFVTALLPRVFTLENVYQYRTSQSWGIIERALHEAGYLFDYWHVNMADYGIPQTRRRMIAIARLDGIRPQLPPATHAENPILGLFGTLKPWVGWYEAIDDLIPGLPESKFAKWQLSRLPEELRTMLLSKDKGEYSDGHVMEHEPAMAVTANDIGRRRAFIAPGGNATSFSTRNGNEPARTVESVERVGNIPRAFIVDGKLSTSGDEKKLQILDQVTPHATVVSSQSAMKDSRAFIVDHQNISRDATIRMENEPFITVQSLQMRRPSSTPPAYTNGRIVQMSTRALARFQSFPDSYELSGNKKLDCRGIGNACPPLFMQRLYESLLDKNTNG